MGSYGLPPAARRRLFQVWEGVCSGGRQGQTAFAQGRHPGGREDSPSMRSCAESLACQDVHASGAQTPPACSDGLSDAPTCSQSESTWRSRHAHRIAQTLDRDVI